MIISESTVVEIDHWDVDKAIEMSKSIKGTHDSIPYGFRFLLNIDNTETEYSSMYYLGGTVYTLDELKKYYPNNNILIGNCEQIKSKKVIHSTDSWNDWFEFEDGDIVL